MRISHELVGGAKESHSEPIYCIAWSKDTHVIEEQEDKINIDEGSESDCSSNISNEDNGNLNKLNKNRDAPVKKFCRKMATCGSNHLTLYEVYENRRTKVDKNKTQTILGNKAGFRARQAYIDVDVEEIFYSCLFLGHGVGSGYGFEPSPSSQTRNRSPAYHNSYSKFSDFSSNDGPQLCCVAGARGVIKVIDTVRTTLLLTLSGHGNEIYDMSACPHDDWLLISASKDESLRLWNVKNAQCIAIFAGHEGHRDAVLSVDWHPLGKSFVSSGMDETIKIWSLETDQIRQAIESDKRQDGTFQTVYEQLPLFSTAMVHSNYVDCVQFVGDLILSKSTSNTVALWKPELSSSEITTRSHTNSTLTAPAAKCKDKFLHLCDYDCTDCDMWYLRFGTNSDCTMMVIGNGAGNLRLFHIDSMKHYHLANFHCAAVVRYVSFTPDDKSIFAVCDDSTIWRWDIGS